MPWKGRSLALEIFKVPGIQNKGYHSNTLHRTLPSWQNWTFLTSQNSKSIDCHHYHHYHHPRVLLATLQQPFSLSRSAGLRIGLSILCPVHMAPTSSRTRNQLISVVPKSIRLGQCQWSMEHHDMFMEDCGRLILSIICVSSSLY